MSRVDPGGRAPPGDIRAEGRSRAIRSCGAASASARSRWEGPPPAAMSARRRRGAAIPSLPSAAHKSPSTPSSCCRSERPHSEAARRRSREARHSRERRLRFGRCSAPYDDAARAHTGPTISAGAALLRSTTYGNPQLAGSTRGTNLHTRVAAAGSSGWRRNTAS